MAVFDSALKFKRIFPKKRLGQHFLVDKNILARIISTAQIGRGEHVLEIGPGGGNLTECLLNAGARVVAVEIDRGLCGHLRERFLGVENLEIIEGDALKMSFSGFAGDAGSTMKVVSNLPYNISGPVIAKFLKERAAFSAMLLMLQKEVAERLVARPSTKEYGALTVLTRAYAEVKREFDVPPGAFRPAPKVTSTVVSIRVLPAPAVNIDDEAFFWFVVKGAFSHRRKTIINSLAGSIGLSKPQIASALSDCAIAAQRRPETLALDEFGALAKALKGFYGISAVN
ncbi:MAG: 16S rRNA (adenine(1518)-N(6)/adenine(1519)-N(6))-dimethyltransferase RsmA [Deltaproteobacteria bacterium]